ncbi:MAG: hypothetical protein IPG32_06475 [Saprospirales bacterium]|nr:hypothetical protein [Saprospirales bacterium]
MKQLYLFLLLFSGAAGLNGQTNILLTNTEAENVLLGNFDPADYAPAFPVSDPTFIAQAIANNVSPDSVRSYLEQLASFYQPEHRLRHGEHQLRHRGRPPLGV